MFGTIVVGTDGSGTSTDAVEQAAELARLTGSTLHLVRAVRLPSLAITPAPDALGAVAVGVGAGDVEALASVQADLDDLAARLESGGTKVVTHAVPEPSPARALLQVARAEEAGLVVVGNRGMRGVRRILGSVPNTVAHEADCAVMIVHTC